MSFIINPYRFAATGDVGGWVELDRTTLGSAGDTITVSGLADKRYYMILGHHLPSGNFRTTYEINNDSGSNYALRKSEDGGSENLTTSQTVMKVGNKDEATDYFDVSYIANLSANEKLLINHNMRNNGTGAGNAPSRVEACAKWVNTSSVLNRIDALNDQGGSYASGSEVVVLGWDPADTHTTNFWEELASVDLSGGTASTLGTGSFTAKKYLWIQVYAEDNSGSTINPEYRVNSDSGSNYALRKSTNGGTDGTTTSTSEITFRQTQGSSPSWSNMFIVNISANEKLFIAHSMERNTAGAGTAPQRMESVWKWTNTSSQITSFQLLQNSGISSNLFGTNTKINVWGAD